MAKSDVDANSIQTESNTKKRKSEEEGEGDGEGGPSMGKKNLKYMSKFSLNCTYSYKTKELKQKAYVLTPQFPSSLKKKSKKEKTGSGSEEEEEDDLREPTAEELEESQKPKNILSVITIREKKRQKHRKNLDAKEEREVHKNVQKITDYLQKWKNNRSEWKFEKLRQIYLMDVMFEEDKINSELWPIALEYLSGTKGAAKDKIIEKALEEIEDIDDDVESTGDNDLLNQAAYRRAREILQNLQ